MPAYPFLDSSAESMIAQDHGLWVYCRCGHAAQITPEDTFIPLRHLSVHQIVGRLRCKSCGRLGAIESVTVCVMYAHRSVGG